MSEATKVKSHFSPTSGSDVRHVYSEDGNTLLGIIFKLEKGKYRVRRIDGKVRDKDSLAGAFQTIRRKN